jgi:hypothetical protein
MQKALTDGGVHLHGENGSILPVSLQSSFPSLLGQEENPQISSATSMQKRKTSTKKIQEHEFVLQLSPLSGWRERNEMERDLRAGGYI